MSKNQPNGAGQSTSNGGGGDNWDPGGGAVCGPVETVLGVDDLSVVLEELFAIRSHWNPMGLKLGLKVDTLDAIKQQCCGDPRDCFQEMLKNYLKKTNPLPSWRSLIEALKSPTVDQPQLAKKLEKQYCPATSYEVMSETENELHTFVMRSAQHLPKHYECPRPTLSMNHFPYLDTEELDETEKELLKGRLYREYQAISSEFGILVFDTCGSLIKRGIKVQELVRLLMTLLAFQPTLPKTPLLKECIEKLEVAADIDKVFRILMFQGYMSFFSYHIIECIIHKLGDQKDEENLQGYTAKFNEYSRRSIFECPTYSLARRNRANLVVKLEGVDLEKYSLIYLTVFKSRISDIIKITKYTLRLCTVEKGCLQFTFQMPHFVKEVVFPLTDSQKVALKAEGVAHLTCEDYQCSFDHESNGFKIRMASRHAFGQRRPPLSVTIKAILERYPDGQIFKEIIQNADDAGARTVRFYLDGRSHATHSLVKPELARFQGPALLAYNDATFEDSDWEGIQNLQRSCKAEDPFKVGKFGIGFNSVYHITDLPVIISGKKLAYLEPQEEVWRGESGQWFDISEVRSQGPDGLAPFHNVCGFSAYATSDYCGTLFRFPLRDLASELSENVYTVLKLHELLAALKEEAKFLLLFLRSIDTIEVFELTKYGEQNLFRVEIAEREKTYQDREKFMDKLKSAYELQSYSISQHINVVADFHVTVVDGGRTTKSHWLVANQVGSQIPAVQTAAVKQHVFPWVGVALELKDGPAPISAGRTFCFLPMPAETSSPLPVHVNGTFGLNDDRRTLKWPGIERKNDPTAEWNTLLVKQLLPPCYALLLERAKGLLAPEEYYSAWPEVSTVQFTNWSGLLLPLFRILIRQPVVWTDTAVGRWILPSEGVFAPKEGQISPIVHHFLSTCGVQLVDVPPRIWAAFQLVQFTPSCITPILTRSLIRIQSSSYMNIIDAHSKRELLRYSLTDGNYSDLQGLFLLPLADGKFEQFTSSGLHYSSHYRYLCSTDCSQELLPNITNRLVDVQNDSDLQNKLHAVATCKITQLQNLDTQTVAQLLPDCFPREWRLRQTVSLPHPSFPSEWFETFWRWVRSRDLHCFAGQLILPVVSSEQSGFEVAKLQGNSPVLFFSEQCSGDLLQALTKLQVRFTDPSQFPYLDHIQLPYYVNSLTSDGILTAIANANPRVAEIQATRFEWSEAYILQVNLTQRCSGNHLSALMCLPVLTAPNRKLYSANEVTRNGKIVVEPEQFDIDYSCLPSNLIIISREYNYIRFLNSLPGIEKPTKLDFICNFLFLMIRNNTFYPPSKIDSLMEQVLMSMSHYSSELTSELRNLKFLKNSSFAGTRKSPEELFDPLQEALKVLFLGEPVFPIYPFDQLQYVLQLRKCGLRCSVTAQEIVQIIESIAGASTTAHVPQPANQTRISRAKAVLSYLSSEKQSIFADSVRMSHEYYYPCTLERALQLLALRYCWLPVQPLPPKHYPACLSWKGGTCTSHLTSLHDPALFPSPDDHEELPSITGSQVYVVDCAPSQKLSTIFASVCSPRLVKHALAHFQHLISNHFKIDADLVNDTVHKFYRYFQRNLSNQDLQFYEWIWIRKHQKFVSSKMVVLKPNPSFRHDLEPYLYVLPDELCGYSTLFIKFGVTPFATQSQIISVLQMIKGTDRSKLDVDDTWRTIRSILSWLTGYEQKCAELSSDEVLYVPIETAGLRHPQLVDASKVVYTDNAFLKTFLKSSETEGSYTFVHESITPQMAKCLGLTPLTEYLDISEDTFEDVGQSEPLTQRLKNILRDYDGGLTIIKELIQNADDAGATVMNICFDARTHDISPRNLFLAGMAESHGPALIVHNNATFTDDDFKNIQKLAGATKQDKSLKIGKFGVGFCSVYHITDVPSFISRDYFYIFDPTLKYIKQDVKDSTRTGKKVTFTKKLVASSEQLLPYEGLYEFNRKEPYSGTMFRLPFRKVGSKISPIIYDERLVDQLMNDIKKSSSKLLLFLRNVKQITFSQINPGDGAPYLILDIRKDVIDQVNANSTALCLYQNHTPAQAPALIQREHWLVASYTRRIEFNNMMKMSTASVACLLKQNPLPYGTVYIPEPVDGEVFCFLPLTLQTGLPVHVSSNFAVMNDRKGIKYSFDEVFYGSSETQWNIKLMEKTIPKAYHNLLAALQQMCSCHKVQEETYNFLILWPLEETLKTLNPWDRLITPLYEFICCSTSKLFYCTSLSRWQTLADSKILSWSILCHIANQDSPKCVLAVAEKLGLPVVSLADSYRKHLPKAECDATTITEEEFVRLFFANIDFLVDVRNEVLECLLQTFAVVSDREPWRERYLKAFMSENRCIPCTPTGMKLKFPTEVVDPRSSFASLYDPEDGVFPLKTLYFNGLVRTALNQLGMNSSSIPLPMLIERAKSIHDQYSKGELKALERVQLILKCILKYQREELKPLAEIPFLPVKRKPNDYPLKWCGDKYSLLCAKDLVQGTSNGILAGSEVSIICEELPKNGGCGHFPSRVISIRTCPTNQQVVNHFCHLIEVFESGTCMPSIKFIEDTCLKVYRWLESQLSPVNLKLQRQPLKPDDPLFVKLQRQPCVWNGKQFIFPSTVAKNWDHNGPYLFNLPSLLTSTPNLTTAICIREKFTTKDFLSALEKMYQDFRSVPINDKCQKAIPTLLQALQKATDLPDNFTCYLPDTLFIMQDAKNLAYNDAPWCEAEDDWTFVNECIPRAAAEKLGVNMVRNQLLEKYAISDDFWGQEFGQKEDLTQRIQNILREYPFDVTVLKELLQNADDAKATKMYVILDMRQHGTESLPSDEWKDLQGPALLVWNDSVFSEKDLKGIQQLGLGNKRTDAESIGMYGIGFNVVYHLTDCPSFISDGTTLCVLDPHCRYVPGANVLKPGRRYDKLDERFWTHWPDLQSAYLQDKQLNCPSELKKGTLFRFPLRSTQELVIKSKLLDNHSPHMCLAGWKMKQYIKRCAPDIQQSLLFLNHVVELKFFVIENEAIPELKTTHWFQASLDNPESVTEKQKDLHEKVAAFAEKGSESRVIMYSMTCIDKSTSSQETEEQWLIQKGVGDIDNLDQDWFYSPKVKPIHGIATRLKPVKNVSFEGRLFCFLPLPVSLRLPVHVNGRFMLSSSRRNLWHSTNPSELDDRTKWNLKLIEAIASSYAKLLVTAREFYIKSEGYDSKEVLKTDIQRYYNVFPTWLCKLTPDNIYKDLAKKVYRKLANQNAEVLMSINEPPVSATEASIPTVEIFVRKWHPLCSPDPSQQSYFRSESEELLHVAPILVKIGMNLTATPKKIQLHFKDIETVDLPEISQTTVYEYYKRFCDQVSQKGFPCYIEETVFLSVPDFQQFIQFLLHDSKEFPGTPFGFPLLLTADGKIRKFDEEHKVINSKFDNLFPQKQELFLHPEMQQIECVKAYFLQPEDDNWNIVFSILSTALPPSLRTRRVQNLKQCISIEILKSLWECFMNEPIFNHHLKHIVTQWALLPSTSCQLFSFRPDQLMPLIDPTNSSSGECTSESPTDICTTTEKVFQLLKQAGMPILNTDIVPSDQTDEIEEFCPALSNTVKVLSNLYYFHEEGSLQVFLDTTPDIDKNIEVLFGYLGQIHFANMAHRDSLQKIKKLPLFRNIDGKLCTLLGRVYIWPGKVCLAGSKKWMKKSGCVFLKVGGMYTWRRLQVQQSFLGITSVSPLQVYTDYIFPHFALLNGTERLEQLQHIREHLLDNAIGMSELNNFLALEFMNALKKLPCIPLNGTLRPVSDFSDPEPDIFTTFQDSFLILPKELSSEEWLQFFRKIGLQTKVSKETFTTFCWNISEGNHEDLQEGSSVLLKYLFQAKEWHKENDYLGEVSQIPFVCIETLPHLSLIKPIHSSENTQTNNGKAIHMTRLCGAATYEDHALLLWTLKPVIRLPELHHDSDRGDFYSAIGVIQTPCTDDVIKNICNISKSRFSNFSLFDKYDEEYKMKLTFGERSLLLDVMLANFAFLQNCECTESQFKQLSEVPCIPVLAQDDITTPVLVQPQQVVSVPADEMKKFQPFLNPLPEQLYALPSKVLSCVGVERSIAPTHIRLALEKVYTTSSGETLDPNTEEVVKHLLNELHSHLTSKSTVSPEDLKPLYLPSTECKLIKSTSLFYPDKGYHRKAHFNLSSSQYSLFSLPPEEQMYSESITPFQSLTEKEFCRQLPEAVAPRALSACTVNELCDHCTKSDVPLPLAEQLKSVLALSTLPNAIYLVFKRAYNRSKADTVCSKLPTVTALGQFFQSIAVITMKNVTADILLSVDPERNKRIATTKMRFFFQKKANDDGSEELFLYVNEELLKNANQHFLSIDMFFGPLANEVMLHVAQMSGINPKELKSTTTLLSYLLKAETDDDIAMILEEHFDAPAIAEIGYLRPSLSPKLGKCIPKCWHHRLDVDIHNIFRSEEWIGYGEVEDTVTFARVGYRILPGEGDSQLMDEYLIYTSDSDEDGTRASVLDMYKFLRGPTGNQQSDADSSALCKFEDESEAVQLRQTFDAEDLKAIKRQICNDLKVIWKLPEDQKRKAIKRLYLKWHPDKNSSPLATKAFQYLRRQINRLANGSPLEEPDAEETVAHSSPPTWDRDWGPRIHQWNQAARAHQNRCARENSAGGEFLFEAAPQPQPSTSTARVWLAQAESDLDALHVLLEKVDQIHQICCHVCFLAHEVAEKALKAGKYAVCGLDPGSLANHNLTPHAIALEQERSSVASGLRLLASSLESHYLNTRFPNRYCPPSTPSNHYSPDQAKLAAKTAEAIVNIIKSIVEES